MHAAPHEFSRTEERMRRYARAMRQAFLVTVALHLAGPSTLIHLDVLPKTPESAPDRQAAIVTSVGAFEPVATSPRTTSSREMEEAAIQAMLLWLFKPYREKDKAVPFTLIVPFRYRLVD